MCGLSAKRGRQLQGFRDLGTRQPAHGLHFTLPHCCTSCEEGCQALKMVAVCQRVFNAETTFACNLCTNSFAETKFGACYSWGISPLIDQKMILVPAASMCRHVNLRPACQQARQTPLQHRAHADQHHAMMATCAAKR